MFHKYKAGDWVEVTGRLKLSRPWHDPDTLGLEIPEGSRGIVVGSCPSSDYGYAVNVELYTIDFIKDGPKGISLVSVDLIPYKPSALEELAVEAP